MTDINVGAITEALNDKSDRDLQNVDNTAGADAVIEYQLPTAENGYTWYRKYKSGWVEQGGAVENNSSASNTINLPVTMSDTHYTVVLGGKYDSNSAIAMFNSKTTNSFVVTCQNYNHTDAARDFDWQVSGMAAV